MLVPNYVVYDGFVLVIAPKYLNDWDVENIKHLKNIIIITSLSPDLWESFGVNTSVPWGPRYENVFVDLSLTEEAGIVVAKVLKNLSVVLAENGFSFKLISASKKIEKKLSMYSKFDLNIFDTIEQAYSN